MDPLGQVFSGQSGTGAAVIVSDDRFDPVKRYHEKVQSQIAEAQKQAEAEAKARREALNNLATFETDGWYRHDVELNGMVDGMKNYLFTSLKNGVNPESPDNPQSYMEYQQMKQGVKKASEYSKQIKTNYEKQLARMEGKQDSFTTESLKAFTDYYNAPFEEQLQTLPPTLEEKVVVQPWFKDFRSQNSPSTVGSVVQDGLVTISSSGANKKANQVMVSNWLENYERKDEVLEHYNGDFDAAVVDLAEDLNAQADISYARREEEAEVYGTGEASDDNPLGLADEEHEDFLITGGKTGDSKATYTGHNQFSIVSPRAFQIYSKEKIYSDNPEHVRDNAENTLFQPESVATYTTARTSGTITTSDGKAYSFKSGERIPDFIVEEVNQGQAVKDFTFDNRELVKGLERISAPKRVSTRTSEGGLSLEGGETKSESYTVKYRTVYVPLDNIKGDMTKNVKGFEDFYNQYRQYNQYNRKKAYDYNTTKTKKKAY